MSFSGVPIGIRFKIGEGLDSSDTCACNSKYCLNRVSASDCGCERQLVKECEQEYRESWSQLRPVLSEVRSRLTNDQRAHFNARLLKVDRPLC